MTVPPLDADFLVSTFENRIQLQRRLGALQQDDVTHQIVVRVLREAIEITTAASQDPGSFVGLLSERNENTRHLQQAYPSSSLSYTEVLRNIGEQIDTGSLDSSSIPEANWPNRVHSNSMFPSSPRVQAISSPQLIPNHTGGRSMVSGDEFLLEQTGHENFHGDVDPFFDFSIPYNAPGPLVSSQGDDDIESFEALVEPDQDLFGLEGRILDSSLTALFGADNELPTATAPWKTKHDGNKMINSMGTD
jgi:hypothetical protein